MRLPVFAVYIDTRRLATYTLIAFLLGSVIGGVMWNFGGVYVPESVSTSLSFFTGDLGSLTRFQSYDELVGFLKAPSKPSDIHVQWESVSELSTDVVIVLEPSSAVSIAKSAADAALAAASAGEVVIVPGKGFSGTNVQVEGVDEADIVKTDGTYIYVVRETKLFIVKAYPPEEAELVSTLNFSQSVQDVYVNGDSLVVYLRMSKSIYREVIFKEPPSDMMASTTVQVYDVSDRASPSLSLEVTVDGSYFSSRMIGGHVYTIIRERANVEDDEVELPVLSSGDSSWVVPATDIYYVNASDSRYYFTNVLGIDLSDLGQEPSLETFLLGKGNVIYVSMNNIYIAASRDTTKIYKISIDGGNISYVADGVVPGRLLNQFSMDECDGYLRLATTESWGTVRNNVYVLNASLEMVGSLEDLASGEEIYSARFMGDRCYLVTYLRERGDPLFTIDLSDPESPTVLGELKMPGYSDYLHPYDDDVLIGLGREMLLDKGIFDMGLKISLYDVSDVSKPVELAKMVIGDEGTYSPALDDHHAFLFNRERDLLVIPILVREVVMDEAVVEGQTTYYRSLSIRVQGAHVFEVSPETGISLRGIIVHRDIVVPDESKYWSLSAYRVERSLYIGDVLYTISDRLIKANSLEDLGELGSVELPLS